MDHNRTLFIANSVYQLMTVLHLRRTFPEPGETELLLTDITPGLPELLQRVEESGLFTRVFSAQASILGEQYSMTKEASLDELLRNHREALRWIFSDELREPSKIWCANFDLLTRLLAYRFACEIAWYEDGFSSYVIDYLDPKRAAVNRHPLGQGLSQQIDGVWLYEPRLAMRGDRLKNCRIPKISTHDREFVECLNRIFAYRAPHDPADFVFLEQSFRAEKIATNDLDLMRLCRDFVGGGRFIVKPHPRNPENLPVSLGLSRRYPDASPWELTLLNGAAEGKTVLTVCSNAALTPRLVFGMDLNTVMLYKLFEGKVLWKEDDRLRRYLLAFQREFAGSRYFVPETSYELRHILRYLGGIV